jgi:hypothetical protein
MKTSLKVRRQKIVRQLKKVSREIETEEKSLKEIVVRLAVLCQDKQRAA